MRFPSLSFLAAVAFADAAIVQSEVSTVIPGRFIVELNDAAGLSKREAHHEAIGRVLSDISKIDSNVRPVLNFTSDVFSGVSIAVSNGTLEANLQGLTNVAKVWPVYTLSLLDYQHPEFKREVLPAVAPPSYNNHVKTRVSMLHDEGILGQGVKVAIVDTGIDYRHPALGGAFGPGNKVEGGWDFVGDLAGDYQPDADPLDTCQGHGTHVAGILAGDYPPFNWTGVAPKATLRVYKITGCKNQNIIVDTLIQADLKAYEDGADIISTSIGDTTGWAQNPWTVVTERIAAKGVFIITAAGNTGLKGAFDFSGGSSGPGTVAVASANTGERAAPVAVVSSLSVPSNSTSRNISAPYLTSDSLPWDQKYGPTKTGMELWSPLSPSSDFGESDDLDGCKVLKYPNTNQKLLNRVLLVRQDNCSLTVKAQTAIQRGSKHTLVINNITNAVLNPSTPVVLANLALIPQDVGLALEQRLINGERLWINFPDDTDLADFPNPTFERQMSSYSSVGLSNELNFKPDVAAPGEAIFSTWPMNLGNWSIHSGTSMATPYLAGVAALWLSAHGGRAALDVEDLVKASKALTSAGMPLFYNLGGNVPSDNTRLAPVIQQGGGLIDAYNYVKTSIQIFPNRISLNDTTNMAKFHNITFRNTGTTALTVNISNIAVDTLYTYPDSTSWASVWPLEAAVDDGTGSIAATIQIIPQSFEIAANDTTDVELIFSPPAATFDTDRFPVYGGYVQLEISNGEKIHIPYAGVAAATKEVNSIGPNGGRFLKGTSLQAGALADNDTVSFSTSDDQIKTILQLRYGSLSWNTELFAGDTPRDVVNNATYPYAVGVDGYLGNIGALTSVGRSVYLSSWGNTVGGSFANGTAIPNGTYLMTTNSLKPFHNPEDKNAWNIIFSPIFNVLRTD